LGSIIEGRITTEKPETKWAKRKPQQIPNPKNRQYFFPETENQMLIEGKPANCKRHRNRKTAVLCYENRKTDLINGQNSKTEKPNAPLI